MNYLYALLTGTMETLLVALYLYKLRWFENSTTNSIENKESIDEEQHTTTTFFQTLLSRQAIMTLIIIFVGINVLTIQLIHNTATIFGFLKLSVLLGILVAAAWVDYKWKVIPNSLVLTGIATRFIVYIFEFIFLREIFFAQLKSDLLGFAIGFGIFLIAALVTHGAIGFGDVKLFGIIGLLSGAICTYATLITSLLVSTVVSVTALLTKKKNRKDTIPFGPCILIGYMISLLLSSY